MNRGSHVSRVDPACSESLVYRNVGGHRFGGAGVQGLHCDVHMMDDEMT